MNKTPEQKIYFYNNKSRIRINQVKKNHIFSSSTDKKDYSYKNYNKILKKDIFELVYPLKIKKISFGNKLNKSYSNKTIFNNKQINNKEEIRYIKPKVNMNEVLQNQRKNRYFFQNKNLIQDYHLKRSLLLEKNEKIKKQLNTFKKFPLKPKVNSYYSPNEIFNIN